MDPLSIAAGVFAIGTAAIATTKTSKSFFRIARTSGVDLSIDIQFFASNVQVFGLTISSDYRMIE